MIDADGMQMRQILQNLIGNALKFRQEGVAPLVLMQEALVGLKQKSSPNQVL